MAECEHGNREHHCIYCEAEELQTELNNIRLVYQDALKIFHDNYHLEEKLRKEKYKNGQLSATIRNVIAASEEVKMEKSLRDAIEITKIPLKKFGSNLSDLPRGEYGL